MLDLFVGLLQLSFYLVLFTYLPVTTFVRFLSVRNEKKPHGEVLMIVLDISAISFYHSVTKGHLYYRLYNILMYIYAGFGFLAFAFAVHMYV